MSATDASGWSIYGEPVRGRQCGSCKLCCVLVPVELDDEKKPANTRCKHLCSKGCGIYERRPAPCRWWSCKWLFDASTADLRRPDHAGYVIDPVVDTLLADNQPLDVIQVWCDPARPDAHRDPALRAWLLLMSQRFGLVAIIRRGSRDGFVLVPPGAGSNDEWLELDGTINSDVEMAEKLAAVGVRRMFGP